MNKTVYLLIDCSGSMYGARADAVNTAMQKIVYEGIPEIKKLKSETLDIYFKVLGFSSDHRNDVFEILPKTALEDFNQWDNIDPETFCGGTPTGAAIKAVIDDLVGGNRGEFNVNDAAPAIILISDGMPNGDNPTYEEVMECAVKGGPKEVKAFRKALRIALGMSVDDAGRESLKKFGDVSDKMKKAGIESYYDCSEEYIGKFVEILKSATVKASVT